MFKTIIADPPWAYNAASNHKKLTGFSTSSERGDWEYPALSTDALCELPVDDWTDDDATLLLWATMPFLPDALRVVDAWGFTYKTGLAWVKVQKSDYTKPAYGVGYHFRGAIEPILMAQKPAAKAVRTNMINILCETLGHSRKPDSLYEVAKMYPAPRLELFARRSQPEWYSLGDEADGDGLDIRERAKLIDSEYDWNQHYNSGA